MEDQTLQPVPELIDGDMCEETEIHTEEIKVDEDDDDEKFYETIEAPKFVDFTKPYTVRSDDRYWFCSRVGCDRKHEEEIDPEEISKNFVLRVMAARSPNIKLQKALYRQHSSIKCPLSAPAKPSKPRLPRSAMVSSLISHKNGDLKSKIGPCSKAGSTPVVRSRQVASKYMTTPRKKICNPDANSFRSVQNAKTTTVDVVKNRTVAKTLVFHSPKKAVVLKKSFELQTPLTKICEGMKRLKIASQRKTLKGSISSKPKKPETEDSSRRQLKVCKSDKKSKGLTPNKKAATYKYQSLDEQVVDVKPIDDPVSESSLKEDMHQDETSDPSNSLALRAEMNDLTNIDDKDHLNEVDNDKENALNPQDDNRSNNQPLGDKIPNKEIHKKNKVVVQTAGPGAMKCNKPKPTSVKPFRLRTDERGILKEAILEKKLRDPAPKEAVGKDTSVIRRTHRVSKNEKLATSANRGKEADPHTARSRHESTQQRSMTSLRTRSQRVVSPKKVRLQAGQQLSVIEEKCCKKSRAVSTARSTSRGKQHVTIAKEPNFHTLHLPRTCSKKIA